MAQILKSFVCSSDMLNIGVASTSDYGNSTVRPWRLISSTNLSLFTWGYMPLGAKIILP